MTALGLSAQLARLRSELDADLTGLRGLNATVQRRAELERLLVDLDLQLERASQAAVIVLVGATGAGKSTLLNALSGREIASEGVERPTTVEPVIHAPEDADLSRLLQDLPGPAPRVRRHAQAAGSGPLSEQVLVDAPDWNSIATAHRETVRALAERADVLLVVLHRQSIVERSGALFLKEFSGRRRVVFLLNRADELTPKAREELLAQVREMAAGRLKLQVPDVLAISAHAARHGGDPLEYPQLIERLGSLVLDEDLVGVRRTNAVGAAAQVGRLFERVAKDVKPDLDALPAELLEGLQGLVESTRGEVHARLTLRRAELLEQLVAEVGRRWEGPVGWALRQGGLSTLGAGAGLLLARRNPLLAAGAAVGGAALARVRDGAVDRYLDDASGLLPEPGELRASRDHHLGPACHRALRLSRDLDALGWPDDGRLLPDLTAATDEAWQRLLRRELPEVAERAIPRWMRWGLDAPLIALALWIVGRAAMGLFTGQYVGLDLLINAGLVGAAWLLLARFLMRGLLGRRIDRLVQGAAETIGRRLEQATRGSEGAVEEACASLRERLSRAVGLAQRWRSEL
jgi:energy-coupling factor transporter ATP-binding protein EcfA2